MTASTEGGQTANVTVLTESLVTRQALSICLSIAHLVSLRRSEGAVREARMQTSLSLC